MKRKSQPAPAQPIVWTRADPAALAAFDPATKVCTMNCGPAMSDPRTDKERKFLCDECMPARGVPETAQCPDCNGYGRVNDSIGTRAPYGPKCPKCGGSGRVPAGVKACAPDFVRCTYPACPEGSCCARGVPGMGDQPVSPSDADGQPTPSSQQVPAEPGAPK